MTVVKELSRLFLVEYPGVRQFVRRLSEKGNNIQNPSWQLMVKQVDHQISERSRRRSDPFSGVFAMDMLIICKGNLPNDFGLTHVRGEKKLLGLLIVAMKKMHCHPNRC
ncbi:hypothetical protein MKW98_021993 [Papaver atlanticum]|uniref:Uncharacterized protein n=1 Tax=Papaver atlanticum TaxID=357466 RepID=A0AAD4SIH5_9MAGN|nr:hypothetical protein MKW98_021993 [Papaver atlanticum]